MNMDELFNSRLKAVTFQDQTASSKQSARCTFVGQTKSCPSFQSQSGSLKNPPKSDFLNCNHERASS